MSNSHQPPTEAVAIVGMAGRFPRARNLEEFWRNLRAGVEGVSFFEAADVQWLPIEHPPVLSDPRYVKARGVLEQPEWFDAGFFGLHPREAAIMDPQHRVFLECAWEALEDAGCNPDTYPGLIGVFAGASMNTYLFTNLLTNPELMKDFGLFSSMIMNDGDFVPTRVSYKLNLRGPSINVQTACSTSLVAVCLAAQSLLTYRTDVALAGGVSITFPPHRGQHHLEGGIMSNDGHCRAFDAQASGTVLGDGAGIVVLKRLSEAFAEGDRIYAVIKGTAINNDGAVKIGYTAPSVDGQAECIAMAQAEAGVEPDTISYVEAHGTGTPLGDPIEIAGLTKAFGLEPSPEGTVRKFCGIGSVKSNIGHLDIAAGVAGLIKTVLALQHGEIPPSLHFASANPKLELERTPFFINDTLRPWTRNGTPRRAGVSSFGIGGTNAHLVLEDAPLAAANAPSRRPQHLLVLSAKTPGALDGATARLAAHLEAHADQDLGDVAFSLQTRRKAFAHRRAVVAATREEAISALRGLAVGGLSSPREANVADKPRGGGTPPTMAGASGSTPTVAFMFPGQGAQAVNMARGLYDSEPRFRAIVDRCSEILRPKLGLDLREVIYPAVGSSDGRAGSPSRPELDGANSAVAADPSGRLGTVAPTAKTRATPNELLTQTRITQPAMFVIEYALADWWMQLGVKPNAMIGHSLGEYVAACLAGVFSLEDALAIVAERARLMQAQPEGAMLAIRATASEVAKFLDSSLSLAATNARGLCVVSGPFDAITALEKKLGESDVASRRLATSHAFHSPMMEPVLRPLADFIRRFERRAPQIPFVSNVTGTWITAQQATDPEYWATHVRQTVRFSEGVTLLLEPGAKRILLEVGPGETLTGLARQDSAGKGATLVSTLGRTKDDRSASAAFLQAVGQLWTVGVEIDWQPLYAGETRRFVSLPTYAFERQRYWIEPGIKFGADAGGRTMSGSEAANANVAANSGRPETAAPTSDRGDGGMNASVAPVSANGNGSRQQTPPTTESVLRQIFGELSGMDLATANSDASFYQLGFDSLFLTQASLAVTRRFGVEITFRQLRDQLNTLGRLAAHLDSHSSPRATAPESEGRVGSPSRPELAEANPSPAMAVRTPSNLIAQPNLAIDGSSSGNGSTPPVESSAEAEVFPLSDAQREIWFASQLGNEVSSSYNESSNIRLHGPLDVAALQRAFDRLVQRHDALRTTVLPGGEKRRIAKHTAIEMPRRDFAGIEPSRRDAHVREFIAAELERPFDLLTGPLYRAHLLRLGPDEHRIVIVVHHLICDGWSLGILQKDLAELYSAEVCPGVATPAAPPRLAEFWARQWKAQRSPEFAAAEEFWTKQFADGAPVLDLPTDRLRPAERTYAGAFQLHRLPADITAQLKALCARYECTVFTVLLAAFDVLLHRLSAQDDLVVGVPAAAQVMDGAENVVGHFANLLAVRSRFREDQPFAEFLGEVRRQLSDALEHWRYPFSRLLQKLNLARDSSRMPLANVVFNSTRLRGTLKFGELDGAVEGNAKRFSHFDLNFNFAVTGDAISLGAYFSTELFEPATVRRWFGHFETLLRAIVARPEAAVSQLALLTPDEREQILQRWNDTRVPYERNATIAELFAAQVERTPDKIALVGERERLTYRELDARAERVAQRLRSAGVGAETLVGVFLDRTPNLLVGIFGILKAGGAYVPLDPAYPAERLEFITSDTRMPVLITERKLVAQLPPGGFDFMVIDDDGPDGARVGRRLTEPNRAKPTASSLAYVIYTSGSTGRPKGVAIEQHCVVALVAWARRFYRPEELDGVLFSTSASFDISIFEIFCPLCLGGKIIVAENVLQLGTHPAASEVRFISGVPSAVAEVVRLKLVPSSVTTVALAGELFPQPLVEALYALPHIERVYELYGPTETTVYSTGALRPRGSKPSLGRPLPNEQIYVLDRSRQPVPPSVPGEIYIGGDKLAREYLNRPELTAEKFVPNPFVGDPSLNFQLSTFNSAPPARLYRTGDIGKWRVDGTIEYVGRGDHQVKVRGFRIEIGEVETALASHPAVAECAVIARADATGASRLLGYAVPHAGTNVESRELREHLAKRLPEYMVPAAITVLESWPKTPNGKLDRKALPDPDRTGEAGNYVAPGTTTEELVAEIWRDVLGVGRVGIHDNFFELGGHSLLATQVIARVHEALEVELSIRQFFAAPTVAGLAVEIEAALIREIKTLPDARAPEGSGDAFVSAEEHS